MASLIAMEAGADFIKTSTGKVTVSSTPEAIFVMAEAILVNFFFFIIKIIARNLMKKILVKLA